MPQPMGTHTRYIQSVLQGTAREGGPAAPEYIRRSWLRCLNQYHLDPQSEREPYVLPRQQRLARRDSNHDLMALADAELAHLYHQLAGSGYSIILTDRDGVLLDYYGDLSFRNAAFRTGLVLGAVWNEEHGGTNGMGTCLIERTPLIVHRDQHFFSRNTGLTCCAAPIFDHQGQLIAVLDASGESDRAQQHTLVLVNMSAQMIENRLFLHRFRDAFVVRFHSRPELLGTWGEGIIALEPSGAITALDRNALFQLGLKSPGELIGVPIEQVFNVALEALLARSQRKSFHPLPLYDARHGGRIFAIAQGPQSRRSGRPHHGNACATDAIRSPLDQLTLGDPHMGRNVQAVRRTPSRDVPILLLGESGTGKESFARALHASSDRADMPFVAVHCGSLSEVQLAHELLGRPGDPSAGIADGNTPEHSGSILRADGGMLFLDDVEALPRDLQGRLLHLIETREMLRADGVSAARVDVRLVTASRCRLQEKVRDGAFREDLFYRLQGLSLILPPLRERQDKAALIRHVFAQESAASPSVTLADELIEALQAYAWPGNLRELRNVLRAMIAMRSGDRLDLRSLPPECTVSTSAAHGEDSAAVAGLGLNPLQAAERAALEREIERHRGNISQVALRLGIGRNTLYRKMKRLGIGLPPRRQARRGPV